MSRHERTPEAAGLSGPPLALRRGRMELLGLMPNATNATFLARCRHEDEEVLAIYKPRRGETPLWDFPEGTLHQREVAAYRVARTIGWPNVPPTVLRDGPEGPGSAQLFLRSDPQQHYFTLEEGRPDDFRRIALFDLVVNNADRKAGHCLLGDDGRIWVIDHGVCFAEEPKLRTVIWSFAGDDIPDDLRGDLARFASQLEPGTAFRRDLGSLLTVEEVDATADRSRWLADAPCFPDPVPGSRPFPWPPI